MGLSSVAVIQSRRLIRDHDSKCFPLASRQSFCQKHSSLTEAFFRTFPTNVFILIFFLYKIMDRLCSLVVRVLGYRSGGPGSIPGTTKKTSSGSGTGST
jgi:hypothetical protein